MSEHLNILVVDDDEMILEIFKDFFHSRGTGSIFTARDGAEALEVCQKNKVDFCFTDLNMPGMGGMEFVSKVQGIDNTIPVAVMTGYPSTENAIATLKNGVVDFLVKPFKMDNIGLTIQRTLEKRDLFVENVFLKEEVKNRERLQSLNRELAEKVKDLHTLNVVMQKVDCAKTSSGLFDMIVKLSTEITGSDESHLHILDESLGRPVLVASFYREGKNTDNNNLICIERVLVKRISEGLPFLMKDACDPSLSNTGTLSLIATPLKIRDKIFGVLTAAIVKEESIPFNVKDLYYLNFVARRTASVIENVALYENIYENLFATLYAFVEAIEARDPYTKQHSSRVAEFALKIGKEMGCSHEELDLLNFSGHLHDIGKIGIRDSILLKRGRLTAEEYEIIKKHPVIGSSIIGHVGLMSEEQKIIRHHHERWDGCGYPDGLKGEAIPFLSRILAVADTYDAMASDRAYRKRIAENVIVDTIAEKAGTQFDKEVVSSFLKVHKRGEMAYKDDLLTSNTALHGARPESRVLSGLRSIVDLPQP
ncbi:MAG: response regulator [Proteobacteria bacterium]|nr:response regulator [Pseudomonadota bacterium]